MENCPHDDSMGSAEVGTKNEEISGAGLSPEPGLGFRVIRGGPQSLGFKGGAVASLGLRFESLC